MRNGPPKPKGHSRYTVATERKASVDFRFQVDLCREELVPRLKRLAREVDARAMIFSLMCHLGWGLQAAQLLGCCTPRQSMLLLERSCRKSTWSQTRRVSPPLVNVRIDLRQLSGLQERACEDQGLFDADAAEAFVQIARWLSPMSKATNDLVVYTCVADILAQILDGQDTEVVRSVWKWVRELVVAAPVTGYADMGVPTHYSQ